jgi:hypothetical protein
MPFSIKDPEKLEKLSRYLIEDEDEMVDSLENSKQSDIDREEHLQQAAGNLRAETGGRVPLGQQLDTLRERS